MLVLTMVAAVVAVFTGSALASNTSFTIEKLQEIKGSSAGYTTSPLTGKIGQTVDYEVLVKNTGNVALTFS
ncbi:MAG: hypothetical protein ABSG95_13145, partial [Solirubrobacteraceae bacterium]